MFMSRTVTMPTSDEEKSSSSIDNYDNIDLISHANNHKLNAAEIAPNLLPKATALYNQLITQSNDEQNIYISNELIVNPFLYHYNSNKSHSLYTNTTNEYRLRNNTASRVSRIKRKREHHLTTIKCEYLEITNESLEMELSTIASIVQEKEKNLAKKLQSDELVQQLRENHGLEHFLSQ